MTSKRQSPARQRAALVSAAVLVISASGIALFWLTLFRDGRK